MLSLPTLPANLQANLQALHERITKAARAAGRDPSSVRLLAVSKAFPATVIAEAARAGQRAFGENYVQEAVDKMDELAGSAASTAGVALYRADPEQQDAHDRRALRLGAIGRSPENRRAPGRAAPGKSCRC